MSKFVCPLQASSVNKMCQKLAVWGILIILISSQLRAQLPTIDGHYCDITEWGAPTIFGAFSFNTHFIIYFDKEFPANQIETI